MITSRFFLTALAAFQAASGQRVELSYLYTAAPLYRPAAWTGGGERFPSGATVFLVSGGAQRPLAPTLQLTADPVVSFDGTRALFAARASKYAPWQIWEADLATGALRQISSGDSDCVRPLYLPGNGVVYTRVLAGESFLETIWAGGKANRITFRPGRYMTGGVLQDGRVLFESPWQGGAGAPRELFAVHPDGSGFESYRCDHGVDRADARQLRSGDLLFTSGGKLAKFTAFSAKQEAVAQPRVQIEGPVTELPDGSWILSARRGPRSRYELFLWNGRSEAAALGSPGGADALQPVVIGARIPPREFPSALNPAQKTGKILCLNAERMSEVRAVALGREAALGTASIERDGSFYVEVPADTPLRLELLDESGKIVRAERDWIWLRPGEQRVCVGCHIGPERAPGNRVPAALSHGAAPARLLGEHL